MARGTAFSELVTRLRAELRRATDLSVNTADVATLKETINHVYAMLYQQYDWPHLRRVFDKIDLAAGQRYYDFPSGLDVDRVERAVAWYDGIAHDLTRGIDHVDYNSYDSTLATPERSDPPLKWDVRWTGSSEQIEIWPIPATNDVDLQFVGTQAISRLVNDADLCRLDDYAVVLFAAAELLKAVKANDSDAKLQAAQSHLARLRARLASTEPVRVGLGGHSGSRPHEAIIRVS